MTDTPIRITVFGQLFPLIAINGDIVLAGLVSVNTVLCKLGELATEA